VDLRMDLERKTRRTMIRAVTMCAGQPKTTILLIARSQHRAGVIFGDEVLNFIKAFPGLQKSVRYERGAIKFYNGSVIRFIGCGSAEETRHFTGYNADAVIVEEGYFGNFQSHEGKRILEEMLFRLRCPCGKHFGFFYQDGTPVCTTKDFFEPKDG